MDIQVLYAHNTLRNYNFVLIEPELGNALVIDPLVVDPILACVQKKRAVVTHIINTHAHQDHIGGNSELVAATGAKIMAHHASVTEIPDVTLPLYQGDIIKHGASQLHVVDTPGHTHSHVCLWLKEGDGAFFSGDTLFNAGCGRCMSVGDIGTLYDTFATKITTLPDSTVVYPGHDYLANNLAFAISVEPDNYYAQELLANLPKLHRPLQPYLTTIGEERLINPFLRLDSKSLIANLCQRQALTGPDVSAKEVFIALRQLRDIW